MIDDKILSPEEINSAREAFTAAPVYGQLPTAEQQDQYNRESSKLADAAGFTGVVKSAFMQGPYMSLYRWNARREMPTDPDYNLQDHKDVLDGLDSGNIPAFEKTRSLAEARQLRSDILTQEHEARIVQGSGNVSGLAAGLITMLVDPISRLSMSGFFTGKLAPSLVAPTTQAGNIARGAATGFEMGAVSEGVNQLAAPDGSFAQVLHAGLDTMALGAIVHAHAGIAESLDGVREDLKTYDQTKQTAAEETVYAPKYQQKTQQDAATEPNTNSFEDSVGAASVYPRHITNPSINIGEGISQEIYVDSLKYVHDNKLSAIDKVAYKDNMAGKTAQILDKALSSNGIVMNDFSRLYDSGSDIAKSLAHRLFESGNAKVVNNQSAAIMKRLYETELNVDMHQAYGESLTGYLKARGQGWSTLHPDTVKDFHREVHEEMNARYHDGPNHVPTANMDVRRVADTMDAASIKAHGILQGLPGETAVEGIEHITPTKGWMRQIWSGRKMQELIKADPKARAAMEESISKTYQSLHPNMSPEQASIYAKAVIRGALARTQDIDTSLAKRLAQDGRDTAMRTLTDNGVSQAQAESILDAIKQVNPEHGRISAMKERLDIDTRTPIAGIQGKTLLDLLETDVPVTWQRYTRAVAGTAAMARNGIQRAEQGDVVNAIMAELAVKGTAGHGITKDMLNDMFSYFSGNAYGQGVSPWVRRALSLSNLALLQGQVFAQLAETGAQIGAVGIKTFMQTAPKELKDMITRKDTASMQQLGRTLSAVKGEEAIMARHMSLEDVNMNPGQLETLGRMIDTSLAVGRDVMGTVTGFHWIKQAQERIAIRSMMYRLNEHFTGKNPMTADRLYSMGITDKGMEATFKKAFTDGTVEIKDGDIINLHPDKWNARDFQDFAAVLQRHVGQVVQQINSGEGSTFFHKDVGAVLSNLKTFTLVAMQKQVVRNLRLMDDAATATVAWGIGTATLAYMAKQAVFGNYDKLNTKDVALGTIAMGNMTGGLPMVTDPIMSAFGFNSLKFSDYGRSSADTGVLSVPAVIPTLNKLAHAPAAGVRALVGNATTSDISALRVVPFLGVLGNTLGVWNGMKDNIKSDKVEAQKAAKEQRNLQSAAFKVANPTSSNTTVSKTVNKISSDIGSNQ